MTLLQGMAPGRILPEFRLGVDSLDRSFPNQSFPLAAVHDFISHTPEEQSATSAFVSCITGKLMRRGGVCAWISAMRHIFPAALSSFGIRPDKVIFIDVKKPQDALWVMEEALKCKQFCAVVGDIRKLDLTASRRLQLAVEHSRVTGFLLRHQPEGASPLATVSRWHVTPLASETEDGLPGVGFPRWRVELSKIRNGKPGSWEIEWSYEMMDLQEISRRSAVIHQLLQAG